VRPIELSLRACNEMRSKHTLFVAGILTISPQQIFKIANKIKHSNAWTGYDTPFVAACTPHTRNFCNEIQNHHFEPISALAIQRFNVDLPLRSLHFCSSKIQSIL
jgi:hypothetical protein